MTRHPRRRARKRGNKTARVRSVAAATPPLDAGQAAREALARRLRERCGSALVRALGPDPAVRGLCEAMDAAYRAYDASLDGVVFDPPMACGRGCIHCCYNQVPVSPPEALVLGFHLLERNDPAWLEALVRRAEATVRAIRSLDREGIGAIRHDWPCLFLEEGTCSIHPLRPLVCRGWNAVDAAQCRASIENRSPLDPIENHPMPREMAEAVQLGLLEGSQRLGLEAGYLVLARAVLLMLRRGVVECAGQWLSGGAFFATRGWEAAPGECEELAAGLGRSSESDRLGPSNRLKP